MIRIWSVRLIVSTSLLARLMASETMLFLKMLIPATLMIFPPDIPCQQGVCPTVFNEHMVKKALSLIFNIQFPFLINLDYF